MREQQAEQQQLLQLKQDQQRKAQQEFLRKVTVENANNGRKNRGSNTPKVVEKEGTLGQEELLAIKVRRTGGDF